MASGRQGAVGIGKEAAWGQGVAPSVFFNATENITEERGRLRESMVYGTRAKQPADPGRVRVSGPFSGMHARPDDLGHLLAAGIGTPETTGAGPYEHVFRPSVEAFSDVAALQPYTVTVRRKAGMIHRYSGGQCSKLTLRQPKDDALVVDADWMCKGVEDAGVVTLVVPSLARDSSTAIWP